VASGRGIKLPESNFNTLLVGSPGVGKSTLAKALAHKLKLEMPTNKKLSTYFVKPANLIGEYRGHTQKNMQKLLDHASDGIVIFDEIDTYLDLDSDDRMILNVLNTHLGDKPNHPIVIGTLYNRNLQRFLSFNQGLQSRFRNTIPIASQDSVTLKNIFKEMMKEANLEYDTNVPKAFENIIDRRRKSQGNNFGHIRETENILSEIIDNMAIRYEQETEDYDFKVQTTDLPQSNIRKRKTDRPPEKTEKIVAFSPSPNTESE